MSAIKRNQSQTIKLFYMYFASKSLANGNDIQRRQRVQQTSSLKKKRGKKFKFNDERLNNIKWRKKLRNETKADAMREGV
jgi:hypothetical protein